MRASRVNLALVFSASLMIGGPLAGQALAGAPFADEASWIQPVAYTEAAAPMYEEPFMVRVQGVYMTRSTPDRQRYATQPGGADGFNFEQCEFDSEGGLDASIFVPIGCGQRLEARYLGIWNVDSGATVDGIPGGLGAINTNPPTNFGFIGINNSIHGECDSDLHSGELNYCIDESPGQTWIIGLRYLNLGDTFHADFDAEGFPGFDFDNRLETQNHLYGLQVGAEADLYVCRMGLYRLQGYIKTGVYGVESDYDVQVSQVFPPFAPFNSAGSNNGSDVAFVGETGLNLYRQLSYNTSLLVGYRILYIDGVALASEQIDNTGMLNVNPIPTNVDLDGELFFHGINLGVEYRY